MGDNLEAEIAKAMRERLDGIHCDLLGIVNTKPAEPSTLTLDHLLYVKDCVTRKLVCHPEDEAEYRARLGKVLEGVQVTTNEFMPRGHALYKPFQSPHRWPPFPEPAEERMSIIRLHQP